MVKNGSKMGQKSVKKVCFFCAQKVHTFFAKKKNVFFCAKKCKKLNLRRIYPEKKNCKKPHKNKQSPVFRGKKQ